MTYRIAVLDDEVLIRKSIALKLRHPAYELLYSGDSGHDFIRYLEENEPYAIDVVLIDIIMPLMNGLEVISAVQKRWPHILFVILSGHNDFAYMQSAIRLGVSDYILKPIDEEVLHDTLIKLIPRLEKVSVEHH